MTNQEHKTTGSQSEVGGQEIFPKPHAIPENGCYLPPEQFTRWTELVANGEVAFPTGLDAGQRVRLVNEVRRRRRSRLVHYVARAIAQDIARTGGQ